MAGREPSGPWQAGNRPGLGGTVRRTGGWAHGGVLLSLSGRTVWPMLVGRGPGQGHWLWWAGTSGPWRDGLEGRRMGTWLRSAVLLRLGRLGRSGCPGGGRPGGSFSIMMVIRPTGNDGGCLGLCSEAPRQDWGGSSLDCWLGYSFSRPLTRAGFFALAVGTEKTNSVYSPWTLFTMMSPPWRLIMDRTR